MSLIVMLSVIAVWISALCVNFVRHCLREQLVDIPNARSSHKQPVPRAGGVGFIIAFALTYAIAVALDVVPHLSLALWLPLIPLAVIGILDDIRGVPALTRYFVQLASAGLAVLIFSAFPQPWLTSSGLFGQLIATTLTLVGFTALINFYNFMDGLDGLVAGCTAIQLGFLALYFNQPIFWLLVAALLGFLYWNWSPAKVFMGDAGSTVLGASVAIALLNNAGNTTQAWLALAITLPITGDAIYTLVRRMFRKENIFRAHRNHLFQRLHQSGWSHSQVALTYIGATLLIAFLIALYGSIGAWLSLAATVAALLLGESYLHTRVAREV